MKSFGEIRRNKKLKVNDVFTTSPGEFFGSGWVHLDGSPAISVIFSNNENGLEHVSVAIKDRDPTWGEMCHVKDIFWHDEEECYEIHPRKSEYINLHEHCLHIWRDKTKKNHGFRQKYPWEAKT